MATSNSNSSGIPQPDNYVFCVNILETSNPITTRTLSVPAHTTFHTLNLALSTAFNWSTNHEYTFQTVTNLARQPPDLLPPRPHKLISTYEPLPHPPIGIHIPTPPNWTHSSNITVQGYMSARDPSHNLIYEYDSSADGWEHLLTFLSRAAPTTHITCIDGSGHHTAEDCGGPEEWEELKEAYRTQVPDKKQMEKRWWYERFCVNGEEGGLDVEKLDRGEWEGVGAVNQRAQERLERANER